MYVPYLSRLSRSAGNSMSSSVREAFQNVKPITHTLSIRQSKHIALRKTSRLQHGSRKGEDKNDGKAGDKNNMAHKHNTTQQYL